MTGDELERQREELAKEATKNVNMFRIIVSSNVVNKAAPATKGDNKVKCGWEIPLWIIAMLFGICCAAVYLIGGHR